MSLPEYEYKGLMAQAWDVMRGDTSGWADRFFYLELIRKTGEPVLDVGCGTGRLLLDYAQQGIDIDGVDNSPEMIDLCRQKAAGLGVAVNLYVQYMETLSLPRKYATILVPSSTIQLIIEPEMVDRALVNLRESLLPGGAVAASVMALRKPTDPLEFEWESSATRADGALFRRVNRSRYDPETQVEHTEDLYQLIVDGKVVAEETHRRSPATRSYTQDQARALFERAGFVNVTLNSEFTQDPVKPEDTMFTVVAYRAGE